MNFTFKNFQWEREYTKNGPFQITLDDVIIDIPDFVESYPRNDEFFEIKGGITYHNNVIPCERIYEKGSNPQGPPKMTRICDILTGEWIETKKVIPVLEEIYDNLMKFVEKQSFRARINKLETRLLRVEKKLQKVITEQPQKKETRTQCPL